MTRIVMSTALPLPEASWPEQVWREPVRWSVAGIDEAFAVRTAAGELVGLEDALDQPSLTVYASARARVEATLGELVVNGLRHGGSLVQVSLARGPDGWLIVVTDSAADRPPRPVATVDETPDAASFETPSGGLGLPMVAGLATAAGWFAENDSKHVWALITDVPPPHLLPRSG
jgi:anti-sigma regulatory factor (Ser/Thr protein kinase)